MKATFVICVVLGLGGYLFVRHEIRSRVEEASGSSLRTINSAIVTYISIYPNESVCHLSRLGPPPAEQEVDAKHAALIDGVLASGEKSGYVYAFTSCWDKPKLRYWITASPKVPVTTGLRYFCTNEGRAIFYSTVSANDCVQRGTLIR